jgi:hypothetical protein
MKALASFISTLLVMGLGLLVMIKGWGLYPISWGWVLGGYGAMIFIMIFIGLLGEMDS